MKESRWHHLEDFFFFSLTPLEASFICLERFSAGVSFSFLSFEIIQKTLGGDVGQDTEYKFYIKEVVLERKRSPPDGASVILRLSKRPLEETLVKTLNTNSILISWFRIACDFSLFDGLVVEFTSFGEVLSRGELFLSNPRATSPGRTKHKGKLSLRSADDQQMSS